MSLRLAARRLGLPAQAHTLPSALTHQTRQKWSLFNPLSWAGSGSKPSSTPSRAELDSLDNPEARKAFLKANPQHAKKTSVIPSNSTGDSIFNEEIEAANESPVDGPEAGGQQPTKTRANVALVTDPDPRSRARWQRKKVIQMVKARGQPVSREAKIRMTERELTHKSDWMRASTKKLVMLSRQIAGKPVDEAITQMRWSKKKFSREIRYYLEEARDLAVASRGMALGRHNGEILKDSKKIQAKDGKWMKVQDPTRLYVAESWVNRGAFLGKRIDYKGRGRMGVIKLSSASITVVLKEEKTRIREYEERVAKEKAKGPWLHHPDRPVHGQRPYYTW